MSLWSFGVYSPILAAVDEVNSIPDKISKNVKLQMDKNVGVMVKMECMYSDCKDID